MNTNAVGNAVKNYQKTTLPCLVALVLQIIHATDAIARESATDLVVEAVEMHNRIYERETSSYKREINDLKRSMYKRKIRLLESYRQAIDRSLKDEMRQGHNKNSLLLDDYAKKIDLHIMKYSKHLAVIENDIPVFSELVGYWDFAVYAEHSNDRFGDFAPVLIKSTGEVVVLIDNENFARKTLYQGYLSDGHFKWIMPSQKEGANPVIVAVRILDEGNVEFLQSDVDNYLNTGEYDSRRLVSLEDKHELTADREKRLTAYHDKYKKINSLDLLAADQASRERQFTNPEPPPKINDRLVSGFDRLREGFDRFERNYQMASERLDEVFFSKYLQALRSYLDGLRKAHKQAIKDADLDSSRKIKDRIQVIQSNIDLAEKMPEDFHWELESTQLK